jgi:hypothetical protein
MVVERKIETKKERMKGNNEKWKEIRKAITINISKFHMPERRHKNYIIIKLITLRKMNEQTREINK